MQRAAGHAGDRSHDRRVREIELSLTDRCPCCRELCSGCPISSFSFLSKALADSSIREQSTKTLVYSIYHTAFANNASDFGAASAQAIVLLVILLACTAIQFGVLERRVHYK